jgi:hypothetical protein
VAEGSSASLRELSHLHQKLFLQALTRHSQQGVPVSQDKLANAADSKALNPAAAFAVAQIAPQVQLLH